MRALASLALAALVVAPGLARAQVTPAPRPVEVFAPEAVSGELVRPHLSARDLLPEKRHVPQNLIAVRTDFRGRLLASASGL